MFDKKEYSGGKYTILIDFHSSFYIFFPDCKAIVYYLSLCLYFDNLMLNISFNQCLELHGMVRINNSTFNCLLIN